MENHLFGAKVSDTFYRSTDFLYVYELWCLQDGQVDPEDQGSGLKFVEDWLGVSLGDASAEALQGIVKMIAEYVPHALAYEEAFALATQKASRLRAEVAALQPRRVGRPSKPGAGAGCNYLASILLSASSKPSPPKRRGRPPKPKVSIRATIDAVMPHYNRRQDAIRDYAKAALAMMGRHAVGSQLAAEVRRLTRLDRAIDSAPKITE